MTLIVGGVTAALILGAANSVSLQSASLVRELTALLGQLKLEAIATADPAATDTFVAGWHFQQEQLLLVAGHYPSAAVIQSELDAKQYRDVYQALSVGSLPDGKVFFHDLTGSGLHAGSGGPMVIMNQGVSQTVFDGNWNDRKMTQKAYEEKLVQADDTYSRLLKLLIEQARRMALTARASVNRGCWFGAAFRGDIATFLVKEADCARLSGTAPSSFRSTSVTREFTERKTDTRQVRIDALREEMWRADRLECQPPEIEQ
jgi:hypothetical protein